MSNPSASPTQPSLIRRLTLPLVGAVIAGFAAYNYFIVLAPVAGWVDGTGKITAVDQRRLKDGTKITIRYVPRIRYQDRAGAIHTVPTITGMGKPPTVGQIVDIFYNPKQPAQVLLGSLSNLKLMPMIFGGVGVIIFAFGLYRLRRPNNASTD